MTTRPWAHAGTAIFVTGLLLAATSCATPTAQSQPTEAPSSPTATTPTAAPSTAQTKAPILKSDNLPIKGPANDGRGEYLQTTIADNDPAMTIDPSIVQDEVKALFSEEDTASATKFILTFMAEEGIDSTINGNPLDTANINAWWERNKEKIAPNNQAELLADMQGQDVNKNLVWRPLFRQNKYNLVYGADRPHVVTRTIKPTSLRAGVVDGALLFGVVADVNVTMAVVSNGQETIEATNASMAYTVTKGAAPGSWLITGYTSFFNTTPAG